MSAPLTQAQLLRMPRRDYMNSRQYEFFRARLLDMYQQCVAELDEEKQQLAQPALQADALDSAAEEEARRHLLRFMDRQQRLIEKIRQALARLDRGEYGYCLLSGEEIGLPRLLARPTAEYCAAVKERMEQQEQHYRHER